MNIKRIVGKSIVLFLLFLTGILIMLENLKTAENAEKNNRASCRELLIKSVEQQMLQMISPVAVEYAKHRDYDVADNADNGRMSATDASGKLVSKWIAYPFPGIFCLAEMEDGAGKEQGLVSESDYFRLCINTDTVITESGNADTENSSTVNKERQNKEQQSKEQQNKEQQNKEQQNKEQQNKEQQSKEQQSKEQQNKEQQNKEQEEEESTDESPTVDTFEEIDTPGFHYDWEQFSSQDELLKAFYTVDSTTRSDPELMNPEKMLEQDCSVDKSAGGPQILIYHTHSREAFADSVEGDESTTIVGAGEYLAGILSERYGYEVLHHTTSYDSESRDYAYSNALPELEELLQENPSIQVVIDLHRDEMPEETKLVMDLQGRPTARFMFFNGMSRTTKGEIDYLENPNLFMNLAFSFQMQKTCNEYYPGLARKIYLKAYRYNMHVCPKTLLIELGAQNNTVEEIFNACDPLAHILHLVMSGNSAYQ